MSTMLIEQPIQPVEATAPLTLDALVTGSWKRLGMRERASCPACGGHMEPHPAPGRAGIVGACVSCGSELG